MTSQPSPPSSAADLAARIRATTFPRIRYHKGYDRYDVDWLLRKVATELERGTAKPDLAASIFTAVATQTIAGLASGRPIHGTVIFLGGPLFQASEIQSVVTVQ